VRDAEIAKKAAEDQLNESNSQGSTAALIPKPSGAEMRGVARERLLTAMQLDPESRKDKVEYLAYQVRLPIKV
jgi:hypothetical protein